jgi:hypothetical protein
LSRNIISPVADLSPATLYVAEFRTSYSSRTITFSHQLRERFERWRQGSFVVDQPLWGLSCSAICTSRSMIRFILAAVPISLP